MKVVDFRDVQERGEAGVIMLCLMMAGNDLALANECLAHYCEEQPRIKRHRQMGARIYFLNLQLGHLGEAIDELQNVEKCPELRQLLDRCDVTTRQAYADLRRFQPGGSEHAKFRQYIIEVRNNISFHYQKSGKLIARAVADRASRPDGRLSTITRGSEAYLWRFNAADDIIDSIICRQIWKVPRSEDDRAEINKVEALAFDIFRTFLSFIGEFSWRFFSSA